MTWAPCPHGVRTRGKKTLQPNSRQPGTVTPVSNWQPRNALSAMLTTETGILTIRSCRQHCHASAPTNLMPDATLTGRRRGTAAKAPSGTVSSWFMGTWTASGMSRSGHPSKGSFVGKLSQQSRNTMEYSVLCCSFSQIGLSDRFVCLLAGNQLYTQRP